jgi:hypothetical protein
MNIYRIFPVLWEGKGCVESQTVYAIDREPPAGAFPTACATRSKDDPATIWDSRTFWRLLPPPDSVGGCCGGDALGSVTWANITHWFSWIANLGYSLAPNTSLQHIRPHGDIYIVGP